MAQHPKPNLLIQIHDLINDSFDLDEFRELCLHLEVKYDNLRGETLSARIHDLVQRQSRQGKLDTLLHYCAYLRPNTKWPEPSALVALNAAPTPVTAPQRNPHQIPVWGWVMAVVIVSSLLLGGVWALLPDGGGENEGRTTATSALVAVVRTDTPTPTTTHTPEPAPTNTRQPASPPIEAPTSTPTDTTTPTPSHTPTITATPTPGIGSTRIRPADEAVMVYVPAGEFVMGSEGGGEAEKPLHAVYLDNYWIDQTEVTNSMYTLCVQDGACARPWDWGSDTRDNYYHNRAFADYPVIWVSWEYARNYCEWAGARLPSEAEWEKAAGWDEETQEMRTYPWGETITSDFANYGRYVGDTSAVSSYPEDISPYGALDMAGNVSEWVADWYSPVYYDELVYENPTGPATGTSKVLRGGSWKTSDLGTRTASRYTDYHYRVRDNVGFRCAQD